MTSSRDRVVPGDRAEQWVTQRRAAQLLEVSETTVKAMIARGELVTRRGPRRFPSVSLTSVAGAAARRRGDRDRADRDRRQAREAAESKARARSAPQGGVWLDVATAARILGVTGRRVRQRVTDGTLPAVRRGDRIWLRRADVEIAAASRAFTLRRGPTLHAGLGTDRQPRR